MSTYTKINGENIEKDNLIFEVLGCLDQCSARIGSAKLMADDNVSEILTEIQKHLAELSSLAAGISTSEVLRSDSLEGSLLDWLEVQIEKFEQKVTIPEKFIIPGKSELESRLNLSRVAVRQAERRSVSLNRYQDLPEEFLEYLNRLSWLLFLLGLS